MTWTLKSRPSAGAPIVADYECPVHGRFELTVQRDVNGDPPSETACDGIVGYESGWMAIAATASEPVTVTVTVIRCGLASPWRISAPQLKRDSVPCYAAVKGGDTERRPGMLDTRPLAEGMSTREWKAKQKAAREERRHHQLIDRGLKTKRVQV